MSSQRTPGQLSATNKMEIWYLLNSTSTSSSKPDHQVIPQPEVTSQTPLTVSEVSTPQSLPAKHKIPKDGANFSVKSGPRGVVNFPPCEDIDEAGIAQIHAFEVYPFGEIRDYCRHIPYNSGKKDFSLKTGRESFEGGT